MIIVSTKPAAQTQYKCPKPKNVSTDSTTSKSISGCLAWYPAVKFQLNDGKTTRFYYFRIIYNKF
jgi:vacuolar protein sorting-associated protein 8